MYCRPYVTDFRNAQTIANISDRINTVGNWHIGPETFKGTSESGYVIAPSAGHLGPIQIPNGWDTERLSFILEVEVSSNLTSSKVYFFQGYSDHHDPTLTGAIDENNMVLFINSYISIIRILNNGYHQDVITENCNVANGSMMVSSIGTDSHLMRGIDVFHGMQAQELSNTFGYMKDTRSSAANFTDSKAVSRTESQPLKYLSNIFNAHCYAENQVGIGIDNESKLSTAINQLNYDTIIANEFISYLSKIYNSHKTTHFRISDLLKLDNTVRERIVKGERSFAVKDILPNPNMSEHWNRSDLMVQAATMFTNAFTAIMLELLITRITISCDNTSLMGGQIMVMIVDKGYSLTNADLTKYYQLLQARTANEILYELSFGNKVPFKIYGTFDIFTESRLQISIGDEPMVPFIVPSFANSLSLPTLSNNQQTYNNLVNDFDVALNAVNVGESSPNYTNLSMGI